MMARAPTVSFAFVFSLLAACAYGQVRILDAVGAMSNVGLVEVRTDSAAVEFGTVCGMNFAAADVMCRSLGFDYGVVSDSPCADYGGADMCGASEAPVAMEDLTCDGGELDILSCASKLPSARCADHQLDSIVYCGKAGAGASQEGSLRLLDGGAPSLDGTGRLEVFVGGAWTSVCASGFTPGSASVACKSMGFAGAKAAVSDCAAAGCGEVAPTISEIACSGGEASLLSCAFEEGDDVFCAAEESVVISCEGHGDTQGRPSKLPAPHV